MAIDEIGRTISMSEIRCLPFDDLLKRIVPFGKTGKLVRSFTALARKIFGQSIYALVESIRVSERC